MTRLYQPRVKSLRHTGKKVWIIILCLVVIGAIGVVVKTQFFTPKPTPAKHQSSHPNQPANNPHPAPASPKPSGLTIPSDFTLGQKIGQLLVVGVSNKDMAISLEKTYQLGGFLLMTNSNMFDKAATDEVKQAGALVPIIAVDQEGGYVSRLPDQIFRNYTAHYRYATGATNGDTDLGPATTPPFATLQQRDLLPYKIIQTSDVSTVMIGNQTVPGLTNELPASISSATYELLRKSYNFQQVTFTDEIAGAKAIAAVEPTPTQAVIDALNAGVDMPLINITTEQEAIDVINGIAQAVQNNQLNISRINEALDRVMTLKTWITTHSTEG